MLKVGPELGICDCSWPEILVLMTFNGLGIDTDLGVTAIHNRGSTEMILPAY